MGIVSYCKTFCLLDIFPHLDMTHRTKVVNLIGLNLTDDRHEIISITKVAVVEEELHASFVAILVNMGNSTGVERG